MIYAYFHAVLGLCCFLYSLDGLPSGALRVKSTFISTRFYYQLIKHPLTATAEWGNQVRGRPLPVW